MPAEYFRILGHTLLYLLSILGWGGLLMRLIKRPGRFWEDLALQIVTGCCSLYALALALSFSGRLHPFEVGIAVSAGALLALTDVRKLARSVGGTLSGVAAWNRLERVVLGVIGLCVLLQIILALTPLIFYDLQAYLFLAPAQFLMSGTLNHILWNAQTNTPLAMQLIIGMSLAQDASGQTAKLVFALIGCLTAAGAYEFIRPAGRRAALLASVSVLAFPEFLLMQTLGAIDLAVAALMVFGAIWARRALIERSTQAALFAGLAFGLAIGSRYQAIVLTCWLVGVLLVEIAAKQRGRHLASLVPRLAVIGGLACILVMPWLVRNYVHFGNPVFPLLPSLGPASSEWSPGQTETWNAGVFGRSASQLSSVERVLSPVGALLIQPSNGLFGMALLMGALLAVFLSNPEIRLAGFIGLSGLLIWGFIRPAAGVALLRYNALSVVFLLTATGAFLASDAIKPAAGAAIALAISAGSVVIGIAHVQSILPAAQSLVSADARQVLHRTSVPSWEAFEYINKNLDRRHDKVLLVGETRAFWLQIPYIAPSAQNGPQLDALFAGNSNPDAWLHQLSGLGLTHLLVSISEIDRWHQQYNYLNLAKPQAEKLNRWLQTLPRVFDDGRGNFVLALRPVSND